ncbi:hypothetical protein CRYUN_Cryun40dG0031000 [Craigia yunnanensis]
MMNFKTYLLVLLLFEVVLFTTPSFADHHKPPRSHHRPPTEETSVGHNSITLDGKPKPPPKYKPPTSIDVAMMEEKAVPEYKPRPGYKPPHQSFPGYPPVKNDVEVLHKPAGTRLPPKMPSRKPSTSN